MGDLQDKLMRIHSLGKRDVHAIDLRLMHEEYKKDRNRKIEQKEFLEE